MSNIEENKLSLEERVGQINSQVQDYADNIKELEAKLRVETFVVSPWKAFERIVVYPIRVDVHFSIFPSPLIFAGNLMEG